MGRARRTLALLAMLISVSLIGPWASAVSAASKPPTVVDTFRPKIEARLNSLVSEARGRFHIPGVLVWVSVPGKGVWSGAYGEADLQSSQPLSLADHLPIGSVTKTFTAIVILRLVEKGLLSLSAPISRWVPQVQNADDITVQMLLNMTSGIYDEYQSGSELVDETAAHPHRVVTPEEVVRMAVAHGPAYPPGTPDYSSTNYVLLGIIAQDITHETMAELITSEILEPLRLHQTSYDTSATLPAPSALDYTVTGESPKEVALYNLSNLGAAGAMVSTVTDMASWAHALGSGELLAAPLDAQQRQFGPVLGMFAPLPMSHGATAALPVRYGLGLFSLGNVIGHNGEVNGYVDDVVYSPSDHATIVVFANGDNPGAIPGETTADAITVSIADLVLRDR